MNSPSTAKLINSEGNFVKEIKSSHSAHSHSAVLRADGIKLGNNRSTNIE